MLDAKRFPRAAAYLDQLPDGLGSFPTCDSAADVLMLVRELHPDALSGEGIAPELVELLSRAYDPAEWIPETLYAVARLMVRDVCYDSDATYLAWQLELASDLFKSIRYKFLMYVMSPTLVLMGATGRWGKFRRGSTLTGKRDDDGTALTLTYPAGLYPDLILQMYGESFRAAVAAAGGKDIDISLTSSVPGEAHWRMSWV